MPWKHSIYTFILIKKLSGTGALAPQVVAVRSQIGRHVKGLPLNQNRITKSIRLQRFPGHMEYAAETLDSYIQSNQKLSKNGALAPRMVAM